MQCSQADDDDKKICRLTSIKEDCWKMSDLWQFTSRVTKTSKGRQKKRMLKKPNVDRKRRRQPTRTTKSRRLIKARKCRSSTGSKPTMLTMWPRRRRLKLLNLHGHSRRNEKEAESRTRMTTKSKSAGSTSGRGVGEDGHDEGQNHDHVERSPRLSRNQGQVETAMNSHLRSSPACLGADTKPPAQRVSRSSPTSPHLRAIQWQARRKRPHHSIAEKKNSKLPLKSWKS